MDDPNKARSLPRPPTKRAGVIARSRAKFGKMPSRANVDATMKRNRQRARIATKAAAKLPPPPTQGGPPTRENWKPGMGPWEGEKPIMGIPEWPGMDEGLPKPGLPKPPKLPFATAKKKG